MLYGYEWNCGMLKRLDMEELTYEKETTNEQTTDTKKKLIQQLTRRT